MTPASSSSGLTASAAPSRPALLKPDRRAIPPGSTAPVLPPAASAVPPVPDTRGKRRTLIREAVARRSGELSRGSRATSSVSPASGHPLSPANVGSLSARKRRTPISSPEPAGAEAPPAAVAGRPGPLQPVLIVGDSIVRHVRDKEPRGIIPLENLSIREVDEPRKPNCFELYNPNHKGQVIKACKTEADGRVVEGNHVVYRISAPTAEEKEEWIKSIKASISRDPFYDMLATRKRRIANKK